MLLCGTRAPRNVCFYPWLMTMRCCASRYQTCSGSSAFRLELFRLGKSFSRLSYLDETRCLILDVAMPGMSGLDVQEELKRRGQAIPIIFITGQKDEDIRKQAFRQGAVKFLYKPFSDSALLDAVNAALSRG